MGQECGGEESWQAAQFSTSLFPLCHCSLWVYSYLCQLCQQHSIFLALGHFCCLKTVDNERLLVPPMSCLSFPFVLAFLAMVLHWHPSDIWALGYIGKVFSLLSCDGIHGVPIGGQTSTLSGWRCTSVCRDILACYENKTE